MFMNIYGEKMNNAHLSHFWGLKTLKMTLKNGNRVHDNDDRWRIYDDDDEDPRHFLYKMMMMMTFDNIKKNVAVMTIWPSPLMTPPLATNL